MFARRRLAINASLPRTADEVLPRTLSGAAMLLTVACAGVWTAQFTRPSFAADPPKQIKDATSTKQADVVAAADVVSSAGVDSPADLASLADHPVNQWIKRTPLADTPFRTTGKRGVHSEHMGFLLAEMQSLARAHPNGAW